MDFGISSILAKEADSQAQSPLFQLAPEIRNLIYATSGSGGDDANYRTDEEYEPGSGEDSSSLASDEEEEEDPEYDPENWGDFNNNIQAADFIERGEDPEVYRASDVERPGGGHSSRIHTSFLRTCRRAYAEAHHQVPDNVVWRAWYCRGPVLTAEQQRNREHPHHVQCLKQARRIHFYMYMFWVEKQLCRELEMNPHSPPQPLPQSNPCLRAWNSFALPSVAGSGSAVPQNLWLDPFDCDIQSNPSLFLARSAEFGYDAAPERPDYDWAPPFPFKRLAWGLSFLHMPNLKVLTVDLEISEDERAEMEIIADWAARTWRFPLGPRADGCTYLSTQGNPVQRMTVEL
ncbi:unnamed protein product [Parascedosporium putredinis]|uniref:Uncharacterized protein n=1 Tax=Parascedosporium putredinis TaxID=1442378 RepID=A0A9P1H521_9PEZI|nr:unnamed protein product [Parascedosporium putredinis]CAI7996476.1 unnamed protein product [Parascedosporium putredinis]